MSDFSWKNNILELCQENKISQIGGAYALDSSLAAVQSQLSSDYETKAKIDQRFAGVSNKFGNYVSKSELESKKYLTSDGVNLLLSTRQVATKQDLNQFATKQDLNQFATKQDLNQFASKQDLNQFASKQDLNQFASKQDLNQFVKQEQLRQFATKQELNQFVKQEQLKQFATKQELGKFAKQDQFNLFASKEEVRQLNRKLDAIITQLQGVESKKEEHQAQIEAIKNFVIQLSPGRN
jgi:hypothetical protein